MPNFWNEFLAVLARSLYLKQKKYVNGWNVRPTRSCGKFWSKRVRGEQNKKSRVMEIETFYLTKMSQSETWIGLETVLNTSCGGHGLNYHIPSIFESPEAIVGPRVLRTYVQTHAQGTSSGSIYRKALLSGFVLRLFYLFMGKVGTPLLATSDFVVQWKKCLCWNYATLVPAASMKWLL
jgi:hypothetical protein